MMLCYDVDTAAFMLETALSEMHSPSAVQLLVEAVYWLESVCAMELQSRAADNDTSSSTPSHLA